MPALTLVVHDEDLAVVRLAPDATVPPWLPTTGFTTVSRTSAELSIVCASAAVPAASPADDAEAGLIAEPGWIALELVGPFEFTLTGILASVLVPLADAAVGIFAISTYDTDYVLVKATQRREAIDALRTAGHTVQA